MTSSTRATRLPYDERPATSDLVADCEAVGRNLHLDLRPEAASAPRLDRIARAAATTAPSIRYEDFPAEVPKREIRISEAAARLANALHLHLD